MTLLASALLLLPGAQGLDGQTVRGRITAEAGGQALGFADIRLEESSGEASAATLSDSSGFFVIHAPEPGEYRVYADQIGYERLVSPLLRLEAETVVTADFELPTDPIEIEGLKVEAEARARLRSELRMFGVNPEFLGPRLVDQAAIERRPHARDFGKVLQWQSIPGLIIQRSDDGAQPALHPYICVRLGPRLPCALNVLNGALITRETGYEIPSEALGAIVVLDAQEATLLYGTDGAGGAVLLFTRDFRRGN